MRHRKTAVAVLTVELHSNVDNQITYIVSSVFNYADYMLDDAGPRFARMYGWPTTAVDVTPFCNNKIFVVDWYLDASEFSRIADAIASFPNALFSFHVVDPWPYIRGTAAHKFLKTLSAVRNVVFSGPYFPTGEIAALTAKGPHSFVLTPYLYEPERELPIAHRGRNRAIFVTGNIGLPDYPVRHEICASGRINPLLWGRVKRLVHSGYNLSQAKHTIVRDRFIEALGQYVFAAVCSSRLRLEFLKYREIAYAGCVPVGDLPASLLNCPKEGIVEWRRNRFELFKDLMGTDTEERAWTFRQFMAEARNRVKWRNAVATHFLDALYRTSRSL